MQAQHTVCRHTHLNLKQALRLHIDQLPLDKQVEFVSAAFELLAERPGYQESKVNPRFQQFLRAALD